MPSIFISYRRNDAGGHARNLHHRLAAEYGADALFFDRSNIESGGDFPKEIARALDEAKVLLALIGPDWLDAVDRGGRRRLDDPEDFVRREITRGLERGIKVIPVLFDHTPFPPSDRLPDVLRPLCSKDAHEQAGKADDFDNQFNRLVGLLDAVDGIPAKIPKRAFYQDLEGGRLAQGLIGDRASDFSDPPIRCNEL